MNTDTSTLYQAGVRNKEEEELEAAEETIKSQKIIKDQNGQSLSPSSAIAKDEDVNVSRVVVTKDELVNLNQGSLLMKWNQQERYIDQIERQLNQCKQEQTMMKVNHEHKLKNQLIEFKKRENIFIMKLAFKEHEVKDVNKQLEEVKKSIIPNDDHLKKCFVDPSVNYMFEKMRKEVESSKSKVEEMQNEMTAWKFTSESATGKRLMAKCRLLYQENEDLGKMISSGRVAQLESNLALHKSLSEEIKKSQSELDEFLVELDENFEGMQSTIYHLQTQLKSTKEQLAALQSQSSPLSASKSPTPGNDKLPLPSKDAPTTSTSNAPPINEITTQPGNAITQVTNNINQNEQLTSQVISVIQNITHPSQVIESNNEVRSNITEVAQTGNCTTKVTSNITEERSNNNTSTSSPSNHPPVPSITNHRDEGDNSNCTKRTADEMSLTNGEVTNNNGDSKRQKSSSSDFLSSSSSFALSSSSSSASCSNDENATQVINCETKIETESENNLPREVKSETGNNVLNSNSTSMN